MIIYVRNLSLRIKEDHVRQLFEGFGEVTEVKLLMDYKSGESRGIAFVDMRYETEAKDAIMKLNKCDIDGKKMFLREAIDDRNKKSGPTNNKRKGGKR